MVRPRDIFKRPSDFDIERYLSGEWEFLDFGIPGKAHFWTKMIQGVWEDFNVVFIVSITRKTLFKFHEWYCISLSKESISYKKIVEESRNKRTEHENDQIIYVEGTAGTFAIFAKTYEGSLWDDTKNPLISENELREVLEKIRTVYVDKHGEDK